MFKRARIAALYIIRDIKNQALTCLWMALDTLLLLVPVTNIRADVLLICRMDAIGDYILFRNYLKDIRDSYKCRNFRIIACLNDQIRPFVLDLDRDVADEFIWIDAKKMSFNLFYRYSVLRHIRRIGAATVFNAVFSREYILGDAIVRASNAKDRCGSDARSILMAGWQHAFADRIYNRLIRTTPGVVFESIRNAELVGAFLGSPVTARIKMDRPSDPALISGPYCCLVPGAGGSRAIGGMKEWTCRGFAAVAHHAHRRWGLSCVVLGTLSQKKHAANILSHSGNPAWMLDMTGKTDVRELVNIIAHSNLVVSVDTSAVHLGAAMGRAVVCLSNGKTIGRFTDYPNEIAPMVRHVYPVELMRRICGVDRERVALDFRNSSNYSATEINEADACKTIDDLMMLAQVGLRGVPGEGTR